MAAIIFDFDGTITDSFNYIADFLAMEAGLAPLDNQQKHELHGLPMTAMARQLGYHWWQMPGLFLRGRQKMSRSIKNFHTFEGMSEVINKLHAEGHQLFIVSSNTLHNIRTFLRAHRLQTYFLQIYGGVNPFGKASSLRQLMHEHHLDAKQCIYVGDEIRDIQAAQSLDIKMVAVTWGFAERSELSELKPTAIVDSPADLVRCLGEI